MKEKNEKSNNPEESKVNDKNSNLIILNDMKLVCPDCGLIPAIFYDIKSKNIYQISAGCENRHLINNIPIKEFYDKCMRLKDSKDKLNDFVCIKHNSNYNSFCKTCRKNICKECSDTEHRNHFISQFYELLLSNEEIIQLKNSIDNEINDVNNFLIETFNKWIKELEKKFNELIANLQAKNKLYNFLINFYETKEFNYQNIYNIKIVAQNQLQRNPLTQEIQTLKNIITRNEGLLKTKKNKEELEESKEKLLKLKTAQLLKILNILNEDTNNNNNYKSSLFESNEQSLESFLDDKKDTTSSVLSDYVIINPYKNRSKSVLEMSFNSSINDTNNVKEGDEKIKNSLTLNEKMEFANEIKLKKRKMNQNLEQGSIVHCLTVLKDYKGNLVNKFAAGLENGNINVYYVDPKSNNIFLDFEIKEHTKAVTYILCLHDGRLLTCSQDNTMKLIEETTAYSYLLSFWRRYYVIQTLTKPNVDKYNIFQPVSVIEMSNNTIISGDWKNIIIWKLIRKEQKKKKKREKINYSFDILDYNRYKYNYYYEIYKEIEISTSVTALLNIDGQNYVSAHYGPGIVTFYNLQNDNIKSVDKIKCVDSATYCMSLIEMQKKDQDYLKDKIVIVGGYKCIYLLSVKEQNLIDKITLPGNDYVRSIINSGISKTSNGFICGGLFNQSTYDIVHYNTKNHLGFSELVINEISRIEEAGKGPINSIIVVKKNINEKSYDQKNLVLITGSNDQSIKSFVEVDDEDEE